MVGPFALDGYDVLAPLDGTDRRWRAICLADGQPVLLRRLIGAAARIAEVRRGAALWGSAVDAGVVRVRDVTIDGADLVVVSDVVGDPLDLVLGRWKRLSPGQVVTLTVGVARALESAHRHGLAHGRLDASSIVLGADGRPLLTDFAFGDDADAAADLTALRALASGCLDVGAPPALVAALEAHEDAATLAARVLATVPAEPLAVPTTSAAVAVPSRRDRRRAVRPAVVLTVAVAVLAAVVGAWWGRQAPAASAPVSPVLTPPATQSSTPAAPVLLDEVVSALDRRRAHAIADADVVALASVDVRGTPLWRHDARSVARLATAHLHLRGLRVQVTDAHVVAVQTERAVARVTDVLSSYDVVDARGKVVEHRPPRPAQVVKLVVVRNDGQWRIRAARLLSR